MCYIKEILLKRGHRKKGDFNYTITSGWVEADTTFYLSPEEKLRRGQKLCTSRRWNFVFPSREIITVYCQSVKVNFRGRLVCAGGHQARAACRIERFSFLPARICILTRANWFTGQCNAQREEFQNSFRFLKALDTFGIIVRSLGPIS